MVEEGGSSSQAGSVLAAQPSPPTGNPFVAVFVMSTEDWFGGTW